VRGTVVTEAGERVSYAVVVLEPGFSQRFADEGGRFALTGVAPGRYRLIVRQVGYLPFDSSIAVTPGSAPMRVQLTRVAIRLAEMRVSSSNECAATDSDSGDAALATVFEQVKQNADRYRLLSVTYPFTYRVSRRLADQYRDGFERASTDTLVFSSTSHWDYAPGTVVTPDPDHAGHGTQVVHLPVLQDLADPNFHRTHCFSLRGIDNVEGKPYIRLDFKALGRLRDPDVDGSAFLDPDTYQIRYVRVSLTQLARSIATVAEWTAMTTFKELVPNLLVIERVDVATRLSVGPRSGPVVGRTEQQRLMGVTFLRPLPRDSVP